jgi:pimeloyl-ACP methyl ester carboxylesterase
MVASLIAALAAAALLIAPAAARGQTTDTIRVKVHNHEIALYRTGQSGPTLILEAGGGSSHRVWNAVVPRLAQHARVLAYDRPGYGLSTPCDSPRTALRIARELNEALRTAGITGPNYLAGWSFGGAIARVYAGEFAQMTRGLLLVDPAPEDFYVRAQRELPDLWTLEEESYFPALYADSTRRAEQRELAGYSASMEQARASDEKHATPTVVLIAGRDGREQPDPISAIWIDELKRWAARRPATTATIVPRAGHHIARENPDAVVAAFIALMRRSK